MDAADASNRAGIGERETGAPHSVHAAQGRKGSNSIEFDGGSRADAADFGGQPAANQ